MKMPKQRKTYFPLYASCWEARFYISIFIKGYNKFSIFKMLFLFFAIPNAEYIKFTNELNKSSSIMST